MSWKEVREFFFLGFTVDQQRRAVAGLLLLTLAAHAAWAHGVYPWDEAGFAYREDVQEIARMAAREAANQVRAETMDAINGLRSQLLEGQIREDHFVRCKSDDSALREEFETRISRNMEVFRDINGYYYRLTPCTDL